MSNHLRQFALLLELLHADSAVKVENLASSVGASVGSISADFKTLSSSMLPFGVDLKRQAGVGTFLLGNEKHIRRFFMVQIFSVLDENLFVSQINALREDSVSNLTHGTTTNELLINFLMQHLKPQQITKFINQLEAQFEKVYSDIGYITLFLYTAISIIRLNNNHLIVDDTIPERAIDKTVQSIFSKYITLQKYDVIPRGDVFYLTGLTQAVDTEMSSAADPQTLELARACVEALKTNLHTTISHEERLAIFLSQRIRSLNIFKDYDLLLAVERVNIDAQLPAYEKALKVAIKDLLEKEFKQEYNDAQVNFILASLYPFIERPHKKVNIVIVCASGLGIAVMLGKKIEAWQPDITVVDYLSQRNLSKDWLDKNAIDLVVSVIPRLDNMGVPICFISLKFDANDQKILSTALEQIRDSSKEIV